ncbi:MAG: MerR family transcriptional regulator [Oscillospiraceae bacterium]|nr:MerR family transcriptional regulator [Oscillospiraceae bacterium]
MSYTIGQVSQMMNISAYTLRYYDKEGLLPFVKRSPSGIRIFEDSDLRFLHVIHCLKNTGMSLDDIREFIRWADEGDSSLQKRYDLFVERKKEVDRQIAQLIKYRECIEYKCEYYRKALAAGTEAINLTDSETEDNMPLNKIVGLYKEEKE